MICNGIHIDNSDMELMFESECEFLTYLYKRIDQLNLEGKTEEKEELLRTLAKFKDTCGIEELKNN